MAIAAYIASPSGVRKLFLFIFTSLLLYFAVHLVRYHFLLVTFPYPLEYREGAVLFTTNLLLKGENPYTLEHMPTAINVYGIVYHLVVYPVARLWGATFVVHRAVSAAFLLFSLVLFFVVLRRYQVRVLYSLSAVLILFASLLDRFTPLARPDGLGFFLFLASIFTAYLQHYSTRSLIVSAVLGIAAFYTKAYFVLSIPYLFLYLFLFVSKEKAILYGGISFSLLILTALIVNKVFETYFLNAFFNHMNVATNDLNHLRVQLAWFLIYNAGLVLILIVYLSLSTFDKISGDSWQTASVGIIVKKLRDLVHILRFDKPLVEVAFPISLHCLILSCGLFYLKLGRHNGNMMTYAYQLMSPFFVLLTYSAFNSPLKKLRSAKFIKHYNYALLMPCILLSLYLLYSSATALADPGAKESREVWRRIETITLAYRHIMNSPLIVSMLMQQNKTVYDAGQTEFFQYSHYSFSWLDGPLPSNGEISMQWENYQNSVNQAILKQEFDAVIVTPREYGFYLEDLTKNYIKVSTVGICMLHTAQCAPLEIWEPKTSDAQD